MTRNKTQAGAVPAKAEGCCCSGKNWPSVEVLDDGQEFSPASDMLDGILDQQIPTSSCCGGKKDAERTPTRR